MVTICHGYVPAILMKYFFITRKKEVCHEPKFVWIGSRMPWRYVSWETWVLLEMFLHGEISK
jgi:hypothetical protein